MLALALVSASCRGATADEAGVRERWYQRQAGYGDARPAVSSDLVYFSTGDGQVIARDQQRGRVVWAAPVASQAIGGSNMALSGSTLVVPIVRSTVALRASTGRELWRYEAPLDTTGAGGVGAGPGAVVNTHIDADAETVYIPAWGASVSAVDLATGAVRWIWRPTRTQSDTAVAGVFRSGSQGVKISGDTVYATAWHFRDAQGLASEAWLIALERTTGRELWRVTMPAYTGGAFVWGSPVVAGNLVIFESNGGHEYAIDRFTQQLVWEFKPSTRNATMAQTELYEGVVYHDGGDSHIYALRAADGTVLWRAAFDGHTTRDLLVTARCVIFTNGYSLHVHDRQTGRRIARVQQPRTADSFFGSPAAYANGQVFVTVGDGAWSFDEP